MVFTMKSIPATEIFASKDTPWLARFLLGKQLVFHRGPSFIRATITEVEAYDGPHDRASHASRGITPRTRVMFGPPGFWYVYLIYGRHEMLNLVTGPAGYPAAVLFRGLDVVSGPGRLTRHLGVDRRLNGQPAASEAGLYIEDPGTSVPSDRIVSTPRIGVDYAGEEWAARPYRFLISGDRAGIEKDPAGR